MSLKHPHHSPKALFILKRRGVPYYDPTKNSYTTSSGLSNSARFVVDMLREAGITTHLEQVIDNNCIDRVVTKHKPTHVIIEALWVVPEKFNILRKLHPNVKWIIRFHSEIPFLSQEGIAMEWAFKYLKQQNVYVALNAENTHRDFIALATIAFPHLKSKEIADKVIFLPNYYPVEDTFAPYRLNHKKHIDVGCFGAIRPLKNQLIQAVAAVVFARSKNIGLKFHINGDRVQQSGDTVVKNIRSLFYALPEKYELIEYPWLEHDKFVEVVRRMDIGLQMSFTETFNIVTADFVANGVPAVASKEVEWIHPTFQADTTDVADIVRKMDSALWWKKNMKFFNPNEYSLRKYGKMSRRTWLEYLHVL